MYPDGFSHSFARLCERSGLGHWHPHELRHSGASLMLARGRRCHVVSEMLGHASIAITKDVYGHLLEGDKRVAAESMSQALFGEQLIYALRGVFSYVARGSPRALVSDPAAPFGGVMQPDLGREGAYEGLLGDTRCSRAIRL